MTGIMVPKSSIWQSCMLVINDIMCAQCDQELSNCDTLRVWELAKLLEQSTMYVYFGESLPPM